MIEVCCGRRGNYRLYRTSGMKFLEFTGGRAKALAKATVSEEARREYGSKHVQKSNITASKIPKLRFIYYVHEVGAVLRQAVHSN